MNTLRYRLFVYFLMVLLGISLVVANVLGRQEATYSPAHGVYEHGWPVTFATRPLMIAVNDPQYGEHFRYNSPWLFTWSDTTWLGVPRLIAGVAVSISVLVLAGFALGRKMTMPLPFLILQQGLLVGVLALVACWGWQNSHPTARFEDCHAYMVISIIVVVVAFRLGIVMFSKSR